MLLESGVSQEGGKGKKVKRRSKNVVGDRVRRARQDFEGGLTQDQLSGRLAAAEISLDRAAIAKIELGLRGVYDFEVIALAATLKVDVRWLLGIEG